MASTRLLLIRHGHTAGNGPGDTVPLSGWTDLGLSPVGYREARRLGVRLAALPAVAAVYASSSRRALSTARVALPGWRAKIQVRDDLREIHCGELDGVSLAEVRLRHPDLWARNEAQADPDFRWPGGESYRQFRERSLAALGSIAEAWPGRLVLVFTHAGVVSQAVCTIEGIGPARWGCYRPHNGSMTELGYDRGRWVLGRFDDREHLTERLVGDLAV